MQGRRMQGRRMQGLHAIFHLGVKELRSLRRDPVMIGLIVWAFSLAIYTAANGVAHDLRNAAIAVVDHDRSQLSTRIRQALLGPQFKTPELIDFDEIDPGMDSGRYTFVLVFPPSFEADVLAGDRPSLLLDIDATASMQAGIGRAYVSQIAAREIAAYLQLEDAAPPVDPTVRIAFNPNLESAWFTSVMTLIQNVTMLSIVLTGAAFIREREHGTIEHLLVMPLTPMQIMLAKVWASALVILAAVAVSLWLVIEQLLGVRVAGSVPLFLAGTVLYLLFSTSLGIFLATLARSMPQFGLLFILVALPMNMLSGGNTPIESQPEALQTLMQAVPSTHFVAFAQAILYRGAGLDAVWPQFAATLGIAVLFFAVAAARFRRSIATLG
ncbi:MAG: ABC transporter permease [Thalassobaculum sp.]|uniref:ABC transporter permease n=1 Tax=Thalassobaculum sp. TaxID=2022740 RepID=UPI0032EB1B5F